MSQFGGTVWGGDPADSGPGALASDLIYHALRLARVTLGPDRTPSGPMYNDGMRALNRMLGSWNARRGAIFTVRIDLWPTATGQQSYTLGPGGDWDGPRPQRITFANFLFPSGGSGNFDDVPGSFDSVPGPFDDGGGNQSSPLALRKPLALWDDKEWASIRLQEIFTYPRGLYNDGGYPLSTLYFHPVPDGVYHIELYTWQALEKPVALTDVLAYPDGYEEAIVSNLACRLGPMFGHPVPPDVRVLAVNSLAALAAVNCVSPKLRADGSPGHLYNYLSGLVE